MLPLVRLLPCQGIHYLNCKIVGDLCKTSKQPVASAQGAFAQWTAAKMPAAQVELLLAVLKQAMLTFLFTASPWCTPLWIRFQELQDCPHWELYADSSDEYPPFRRRQG